MTDIMDIRECAEYLGISPDTMYKYAADGTIPGFKLGNRWKFSRLRLEKWMDEQSDKQKGRNGDGKEEAETGIAEG